MLERLSEVESRSMHGQLPVFWDRAAGSSVHDPWGNRWIDFTSTIFVANAGHGHPTITDAITNTANKPLLHAYNYGTMERVQYLEALIAATPLNLQKAFLVSAGTEAVEVAMKLMKLHAIQRGKRRSVIISFGGNWHGRTTGAQQLSSDLAQSSWIGYEDPNIVRLPFPYPWIQDAIADPKKFFWESLNRELDNRQWTLKDDVAGFILESYQGWGAIFYPSRFVQEIERAAQSSEALLVFDEMQAGFARTGKFFGYEHYGVRADLVCCGKGASSSVPLAFVLGASHLLDLPGVGSMSSTHSANPISCAAGLANLQVIENERLVERAEHVGEYFHARLNEIADSSPAISSVQGRGMVAALITQDVKETSAIDVASQIAWECMCQGLLVVDTSRDAIKLAPPLTIEKEALDEGLGVLSTVVKAIGDRNLERGSHGP